MAEYIQSQMTLPSGDVVKFKDNVSGYLSNAGDLAMYNAETVISGIETPVIVTSITEQTVFNISGVEFTIELV